MNMSMRTFVIAMLAFLTLLGCAVNEEKIELWKGTKNGPKKLAATAVDKDVQIPLRAKAVVALTEISDRSDENIWELFIKAFEKMDKGDSAKIIEAAAPILAKKVATAPKGSVSKTQVSAKDALYVLLDFASGNGKTAVEKALIDWCTKDYNIRALAGKYNISAIVKKIGPSAAEALTPLLNVNEVTIKYIADLIHDINDPKVTQTASQSFAKNLKANIKKIQEIHLVAASIIGGDPLGKLLLEFAANPDLSPELQRFSLRAFSEGVAKQNIASSKTHLDALFEIAENSKLDQHQREEAYYVIAQMGGKDEVNRVRKLLRSKTSFWRMVGLRTLLRLDGESLVESVLKDIEKSKKVSDSDEVDEIVVRIAAFPAVVVKVRELLSDESEFIAGIAVAVLGEAGTKDDLALLKSLLNDERNLPKSFKHKKLSDAVKAAMEKIEERG
jgi:hypothetical protein